MESLINLVESELDEITVSGNVAGAAVSSDKNNTPWDDEETKKFNKKAAKDQRLGGTELAGTKLEEEELIEKVLHYLLTRGAVQ
tara:strand:- start:905 stop:1156 length:252 start_codon:yes stop_codon:yes gene_type:complete